MKLTFKKIFGAAIFAAVSVFATGSFISCDNGNTDVNAGNESNEEELAEDPAEEVKWEYVEEGTVTRIAIELNDAILGDNESPVTTWENIKFYGWAEKAGLDAIKPLGEWGGTKAIQLEENSNIYYVNIPAAGTPKTESINLIVNGSAGSEDDQISIGSIKAGESKIYKIAVEGEDAALFDWDGVGAVAEGEEPEEEVVVGKIIVGVTADAGTIDGWESVYVYVWGDNEVFGGWPGTKAELNEELGIYTVEAEVEGESWNVIFNNNGSSQFDAGKVKKDEIKLYTRAGTWVDWDGESADATEAPAVVVITEESTVIAIDVSTDPQGKATGWSNADVKDTSENDIFGGTVILTKSESNSNIWYADITGKEGTAQLVFSNTKSASRETNAPVTIEAGKKYIYNAGNVIEWEDFSLEVINESDKANGDENE